jgi:prenyl protein peptidase
MFTYTTVFGWYAALLFHRTRHLLAPVVAHMVCNHLGLPAFYQLPSHPHRRLLCAAYVAGVATFAALLLPLTSPALYR